MESVRRFPRDLQGAPWKLDLSAIQTNPCSRVNPDGPLRAATCSGHAEMSLVVVALIALFAIVMALVDSTRARRIVILMSSLAAGTFVVIWGFAYVV